MRQPLTDLLTTTERPLLGVAGDTTEFELGLAAKFDELHQLLYTQGGVRPTNAAIEEVGKLILLRLWLARDPHAMAGKHPLTEVFAGALDDDTLVSRTKQAFTGALTNAGMFTRDAENGLHPLWPVDEPFRLNNAKVLRRAIGIVEDLVSADTVIADPLGTAFDAFLSGRYDHSGGLGTFLTPSSVARAMAEIALSLVDPFEDWDGQSPIIGDPFCGTGRFLVAAFDVVKDRGANKEMLGKLLDGGLLGADQSATAIAKSGLNLMLYGARSPLVFSVRDSMTDSHLDARTGSMKLILTNPPFGGGKYDDAIGIERTRQYLPSVKRKGAIDPALAGIARSLSLLAPGGVLAIVLPDGIVNGRNFDDLLANESLAVAASISLPTTTFSLSGTVAKTSAVFIQKSPARERTVLGRVDHVGFLKQAGRAVVDPEGSDLPRIASGVLEALSLSPTSEAVVSVMERPLVASVLRDGLKSVDPNRLDPVAVNSRLALHREGGQRLGELIKPVRTRRKPRATGEAFVSVLHVDALGTISWHEAASYHPITPGQSANQGEILVSLLNPAKLRAGVVSADHQSVVCSMEFGVFRSEHNPYAILALLYHPQVQAQLKPLGSGTSSSRRRIAPNDVLELIVPALSDDELAALGRSVQEQVALIERGRPRLEGLYTGY